MGGFAENTVVLVENPENPFSNMNYLVECKLV